MKLVELFSSRHLIESGGALELRSFAHAGTCSVAFREGVHQQLDAKKSEEHGVYRRPGVVWQSVEWEGGALDVIGLRREGPMHVEERHYVLAATRARGEAFYAAVCRWNHELRDEVLVFSDGCFSKNPKLFESIKRASFDQLTLEGTFKDQIRDDFKQFLASRRIGEGRPSSGGPVQIAIRDRLERSLGLTTIEFRVADHSAPDVSARRYLARLSS